MAVTLTSTGITFSDSTTQSSAATSTTVNGDSGDLSIPLIGGTTVTTGTTAKVSPGGTSSSFTGNGSWASVITGTFGSSGTATMAISLGVPGGNYSYARARLLVNGSVSGSQINGPSRGSGSGTTTVSFSSGDSWDLQKSSAPYGHNNRITSFEFRTNICMRSSSAVVCGL